MDVSLKQWVVCMSQVHKQLRQPPAPTQSTVFNAAAVAKQLELEIQKVLLSSLPFTFEMQACSTAQAPDQCSYVLQQLSVQEGSTATHMRVCVSSLRHAVKGGLSSCPGRHCLRASRARLLSDSRR